MRVYNNSVTNWVNASRAARRGVGATIAAVILILIFFGILIPLLLLMSNGVLTWQQTYYAVGVFQQNYLTFNTNLIAYWAILFIFFPVIVWGLLQAMRRRQEVPEE
jgi:hypothetical protein